MGWREKYKVHPAADVFPMMSDDDLARLGEDIKKNGQSIPVLFWRSAKTEPVLIDGRNRLEAMERAGIDPRDVLTETFTCKDPVTHIISLNLKRRHLTSGQIADILVALAKAEVEKETGSCDPVSSSKGGRGKKNPVKDKALKANKALPKDQQVSEPTIKRAIAKAEGREPHYAARPMPKPKHGKPVVGLAGARRYYLDRCADPGVDLDEEMGVIIEALKEIAGKRVMSRNGRADHGEKAVV